MFINSDLSDLSFHDLILRSSRFWIVRSSRTMTKNDVMDRH